ncbi:MAG: hypothetical protein WB974_00805 [Acidobacteriaceae bacterium]
MSPSWHALNSAIWTLALALQIGLAALVLRRGIPRTFPAFTALILFYPLRASLLFVLPGRIPSDALEATSTVLAVLGLLLQAWLVVELVAHLMRGRGNGRRALVPLALVPLAAAAFALVATWLTLVAIPSRIEVDRTQILFWWIMLALAPPTMSRRLTSNLAPIAAGFAAFSLCQLVALAGRSHAWLARNRHAYVAWEYVPAVAWILVVACWMAWLKREERPPSIPVPT